MRKWSYSFLLCFLIVALFQPTSYADSLKPDKQLTVMVKSSPSAVYHSDVTIQSAPLLKAIRNRGLRRKTTDYPISDSYLVVNDNGITKSYVIDRLGNLFDESVNESIELPPKVKAKLARQIAVLRAKHYGRMLHWSQAQQIVTRKSIITVIDIETGLHFKAQRRAGHHHADVQPLTKTDTTVMKEIYQGKWSWKRRAVIVRKDDDYLAASMHGMPHGGDGIPDNGFNGHFCIHFLGSVTHGSGNSDVAHQLMVHKAAGQLTEYIERASPEHAAEIFITAINQHDPLLLQLLFTHPKHPQLEEMRSEMNDVQSIRNVTNIDEREAEDLLAIDIPVTVSMYRAGENERKLSFILQLRRLSLTGPWKIDYIENNPFTNEEMRN